jgi:hypothetical protein
VLAEAERPEDPDHAGQRSAHRSLLEALKSYAPYSRFFRQALLAQVAAQARSAQTGSELLEHSVVWSVRRDFHNASFMKHYS